ncbi:MAG: AzlC family ABC transporter permease [Firmicutes bacterium]|nr:AzlC family ABC transporter permease [Bacillota bacterium]
MDRSIIKKAFIASVPVMSGYVVLGIAYGVLARDMGLTTAQGAGMSVIVYAGSLQFVLISLLSGGASILTVALTSLLVNARHLFYGISMIEGYRDAGKAKPYMIFTLTDETYSLVCSVPDDIPKEKRIPYCFFVSAFDHCWWVAGGVIGCLLGSAVNFSTEGLDFALTALFISVMTGQWLDHKDHRPALTGAAASLVCLMIFGPDAFLIPSMIAIAALLLILRPFIEGRAAD